MDSPVEGFRLSPQQRSLWSVQQSTGQTFRAFSVIRIDGDLSAARLQQAVEEVVSKHEILRTTFVRPPGIKSPFQVIGDEPQLDLNLIKRAADVHELRISLPALCSDSTSLANFTRELCAAYGSQATTEPMQYADFAEWQHELLEADDKAAQAGKRHWLNLQDLDATALTLPHEKRAVRSESFEPASIEVDLNAAELESFAREQAASVSAVLFACWQALVWRLNGETESKFVLHHLSSGRKSEDLTDALGLYAKYLPIRCYCDNESFAAHLRRVNDALTEADKWQEYFDPGTSKSISVAYDFEDRPIRYDAGDLSFTVVDQYTCFSPFKLKLSCVHYGAALSARLQYDKQVFAEETVKRIAGYFERLLAGVLANPQSRLGDIEIVDAAEEALALSRTTVGAALRGRPLVQNRRIDETGGHGEPPLQLAKSGAETIHELFEAQVARTPAALAVVSGDEELTYDELNSRANQLAHLLRKRGVRPDVCVGLCVERSAEMIVGILGILKAGGAYVPLNPDHPPERLATQLADSNASLLITSGGSNGESLDLLRDRALLESELTHNRGPPPSGCIGVARARSSVVRRSWSSHRPIRAVTMLRRALGVVNPGLHFVARIDGIRQPGADMPRSRNGNPLVTTSRRLAWPWAR